MESEARIVKRFWRIPALLALAAGLSTASIHAGESFDIVPLSWVTGTGRGGADAPAGNPKGAIVFPSFKEGRGVGAVEARSEVKDFLLNDNRIPAILLEYKLQASPTNTIKVFRMDKKSPHLTITASASTVKVIRGMSWKEFRALQYDFACWLILKNHPIYLLDHLDKPIEGFREPFERNLRGFWRQVLATASFDAFAAEGTANAYYFPTLPVRQVNATAPTPGLKMGAIPLRPGMRLAIHWGGTAVYSHKRAGGITRPTVGGVSYVSIGGSKTPVLAVQAGLGDGPANLGTDVGPPAPDMMPYGVDNTFTLKVLPVYNDFDLNHGAAFKPGIPNELVLFTPCSYVKADPVGFPVLSAVNPTYSTSEGPEMSEPGVTLEERFANSFSYRFILWGGKEPITGEAALKILDPKLKELSFDHRPMIFGNQTWIDVEMPISMNGMTTQWVKVGTRLSDFLMDHGSFMLFATPQSTTEPLVRFMRARLPQAGAEARGNAEFRFWMPLPEAWASKVQLLPSDCFLFKP